MPRRLLVATTLALALALPAVAQDIDEALAAEGEGVFRQCQVCHEIGEGARNRVGPSLNGVYGGGAAEVEGFRYSAAMQRAAEAGLFWDEETLHEYLANPRAVVPGTSMAFAGVRNERQRAAVIEYMKVYGEADD